VVAVDPLDQPVDSRPAAGRVQEAGVVGQRLREQHATALGVGFVQRREVDRDQLAIAQV
jgi:hypothetical protein